MKGLVTNIEEAALANEDFRRVLYTAGNCQLVLMSLKPSEDIGEEVHQLDQFIRCESGSGLTILDGIEHAFTGGFSVLIPAGVRHNIVNTSPDTAMKLYTLYAPPNHQDGIVHHTKADAAGDEEHFEGTTSV